MWGWFEQLKTFSFVGVFVCFVWLLVCLFDCLFACVFVFVCLFVCLLLRVYVFVRSICLCFCF